MRLNKFTGWRYGKYEIRSRGRARAGEVTGFFCAKLIGKYGLN